MCKMWKIDISETSMTEVTLIRTSLSLIRTFEERIKFQGSKYSHAMSR